MRGATRLVTRLRASVMDEDGAAGETATRQKAFKVDLDESSKPGSGLTLLLTPLPCQMNSWLEER
jgi:hypothetical protein